MGLMIKINERMYVFYSLKVCLHRILLIRKGKRVTHIEKPGRYYLNQEIKVGLIKDAILSV